LYETIYLLITIVKTILMIFIIFTKYSIASYKEFLKHIQFELHSI